MARYDVYRQDSGSLLLDVQADILDDLNVRATVPLLAPDRAPMPIRTLNPKLVIHGETLMMMTQYIGAVPTQQLSPPIENLSRHHDEIIAALDMLFQGF